jgi:peptide-methionine (S)-S-oxide reductase
MKTILNSKTAEILTLSAIIAIFGCQRKQETTKMTEPVDSNTNKKVEDAQQYETATFAAGCFWGVEATFRQIKGVISTLVGYTGGTKPNPTYREVCSKTTGHAEAVQVIYDPKIISYEQLLDVFWNNHNPTQYNRQGPDIGDQYRSAIFFHSFEQEAAAKASKEKLEKSGKFNRPIVTQIVPAETFYRAEEYHQRYLEKQGLQICY